MTQRTVETRPLETVTEHLSKIEQTMLDLDVNERVNILAYAIAGYIVAMTPPGERVGMAKAVGKALTFTCLPFMSALMRETNSDPHSAVPMSRMQ